jgi:hypothetical protein
MLECSFLIPVTRDLEIADGTSHPRAAWKWLERELCAAFGAMTIAPGEYRGVWPSFVSKRRVSDKSKKYEVANPRKRVPELRSILKSACLIFKQQCLYLSVAGHVEFIKAPIEETEGDLS